MKRKYSPRKTAIPEMSIEDQWAKMYGESITKVIAARVLNVSRQTIYTRIAAGCYQVDQTGRVLVRSMAVYHKGVQS
ncbi:MAG: hypothetical protein ABFE07_17125 [Armatimonadia bacterium]